MQLMINNRNFIDKELNSLKKNLSLSVETILTS